MPIKTKYIFATLENWTIRLSGRKLTMLYFEVVIELLQTYVSGLLVIIDLFGIFWWGGLFLKNNPSFLYEFLYCIWKLYDCK